jgi:hypothetical protein
VQSSMSDFSITSSISAMLIVTSAYIYIILYIQNNPTPRFVRTSIFSKWSLIIR